MILHCPSASQLWRAGISLEEAAPKRHRRAPEAAAGSLRPFEAAHRGLGRITGWVDVEDMPDALCRELCIGK